MATVIKPNNSFMNNAYNLNNQLMQQNRDRVSRATQQWKIARQEQDAVGMANAKNLMENKGFLSEKFGIGGKYNQPYNAQNLPQNGQRGTQGNAQGSQPSKEMKGLQAEKQTAQGVLAKQQQSDIQGRKDKSRLAGSNWEASGANMVEGKQSDLQATNPYEQEQIEKIKRDADTKLNQSMVGEMGDINLATNQAIEMQDDRNLIRGEEKDIMNERHTVPQPSKGEEAVANVDHKIKIQERREQLQNASKQEKGQVRKGWDKYRSTDPKQLQGTYGDRRRNIINSGLDYIGSVKINSPEAYRKVAREFMKIKSQVGILDDHFDLKGKGRDLKLSDYVEKYKAPKRSGRREKLEPYYFTDSSGKDHMVKLDKNASNDQGRNRAKINRMLKKNNIKYGEDVYSAFSPRSKSKGDAKLASKLEQDELYERKQLENQINEHWANDKNKKAKADKIYRETGVRFDVNDSGDVTYRSGKALKSTVGYRYKGKKNNSNVAKKDDKQKKVGKYSITYK